MQFDIKEFNRRRLVRELILNAVLLGVTYLPISFAVTESQLPPPGGDVIRCEGSDAAADRRKRRKTTAHGIRITQAVRSIRWKFDGTVCIETDDAHYCVSATYAKDGTPMEASISDVETNVGDVPSSVPDWVTLLPSTPSAFDETKRGAERMDLRERVIS